MDGEDIPRGIDAARVGRFFEQHLPAIGSPLRFELISGLIGLEEYERLAKLANARANDAGALLRDALRKLEEYADVTDEDEVEELEDDAAVRNCRTRTGH